jgi:hypothetical protein
LAVVARGAVVKVAEKEAERGEVESAVGMVAAGAQRLEDRVVAVVAAMAAAAEGASRAVARAGVASEEAETADRGVAMVAGEWVAARAVAARAVGTAVGAGGRTARGVRAVWWAPVEAVRATEVVGLAAAREAAARAEAWVGGRAGWAARAARADTRQSCCFRRR